MLVLTEHTDLKLENGLQGKKMVVCLSRGVGLARKHLQRCQGYAEGEAFLPTLFPFRVLYHVVC
jgi:hypothetical protein